LAYQQQSRFRVPASLADRYRRWPDDRFDGWVDAAFFERMTPGQRSDPGGLLRHDGAEIVRSRRNVTARVTVDRQPVWVKRFQSSGAIDRLVYAPRPGKAVYAWNAAMALLDHDLCTPRPLLGLRSAGSFGGAAGIAVFEDMADHLSLQDLLTVSALDDAALDRAAAALGGCLRGLHDLGFRHRDLRQGNILAAPGDDSWMFCFLDLNRLRVQPPLNTIQRLREVERLNLPAEVLEAFFAAYMPYADTAVMAAKYKARVAYARGLERLPLGRLIRKAWYYSWELRAFSRARRP